MYILTKQNSNKKRIYVDLVSILDDSCIASIKTDEWFISAENSCSSFVKRSETCGTRKSRNYGQLRVVFYQFEEVFIFRRSWSAEQHNYHFLQTSWEFKQSRVSCGRNIWNSHAYVALKLKLLLLYRNYSLLLLVFLLTSDKCEHFCSCDKPSV